jgi:hypothetical protein
LASALDAALEDLSYRGDEPHRLAARTSARHDVMMICAKYAIEMSRECERERILSEMTRREFGDDPSDRTGKNRPRAEGR